MPEQALRAPPTAMHWALAKISREKVVVVLGRAIDALGSLLFLKLLSTVADKAQVGTYLLASSFLAVVLTVSFSALDQGLLRNVVEYRQRGTLARRYSAMLTAYVGLAVLIAGVAAAAMSGLDLAEPLRPVLLPLSLWLACDALKNLSMTVASGQRARDLIAWGSGVDYGLRLTLLWAVWSQATVTITAILSVLAAASMATVASYLWGQRGLLGRFSAADLRGTLSDSIRFAWPMIIWGLFGWLQNMSNRWMLSHFADLTVVAEYGVLVAIGTFPVTVLLGLVVTYIVPILYERESANPGSARRIVWLVALGLLPLCALLVLMAAVWHREIVILLSGIGYSRNSEYLPVIMAAACISATCSILTYAVYAQRRVASLLLANTLPGVLSVCVGYFAVGQYQLSGAVLTLIVSHIAAAGLYAATYMMNSHSPAQARSVGADSGSGS